MQRVTEIATNVITESAYSIVYGRDEWGKLTDVERANLVRLVHISTVVNRRLMLLEAREAARAITQQVLRDFQDHAPALVHEALERVKHD